MQDLFFTAWSEKYYDSNICSNGIRSELIQEESAVNQSSQTGCCLNPSAVYPETTLQLLNLSPAHGSGTNYQDESMTSTYQSNLNVSPIQSFNTDLLINEPLSNSMNGNHLNENNIQSTVTLPITLSHQRRGSLQLWQFLVALLDDSNSSTGCITWTGKGLEVSINVLISYNRYIFSICNFPLFSIFLSSHLINNIRERAKKIRFLAKMSHILRPNWYKRPDINKF